MIGSTNAYSSFYDENDYDFDTEEYFRKQQRRKFILIGVIVAVIAIFITISIVAYFTKNPSISYDLTLRNDFSKDFTDPNIIKEYYPE